MGSARLERDLEVLERREEVHADFRAPDGGGARAGQGKMASASKNPMRGGGLRREAGKGKALGVPGRRGKFFMLGGGREILKS